MSVLVFEMSSPATGNAFSLAVARELLETLVAAFKSRTNAESPSAFVLCASGQFFCAGGNLSDYSKMLRASQGVGTNREIASVLKMISELPVPTVCLVQGDCLGGGVELISAFDRIITAPEVGFGLWQRRQGLTFGWGGGERLAKRIGSVRLRGLSIETRLICSWEARSIGLVDEICLASRLRARAEEWIEQINARPLEPLRSLKAMRFDARTTHRDSERSWFERLWWSENHRAILALRRRL